MTKPKALKLQDVSFTYDGPPVHVIDGITLELRQGERVAILGESGSGKTTLVGLLAGLLAPSAGQALLGGEAINRIPAHDRNIALVLQRPPLLLGTTVHELLRRPAKRNGFASSTIIGDVLERLNMPDLENRRLTELSGGQLQRVHIGRALVWKPDFILLDEPFNSIDVQLKHSLYPIIRQHQTACGSCMILVTHDPQEALLLCDRLVIMKDGLVIADAPAERMLAEPPNISAAQLIGGFATNVVNVRLRYETGSDLVMDSVFGTNYGCLDLGGESLQLPAELKAVLGWSDVVGQPIDGIGSCPLPVFTTGSSRGATPGNPVLYMHQEWTFYGRPLPVGEKATLAIAAERALLYDAHTERLVGRFVFSGTTGCKRASR